MKKKICVSILFLCIMFCFAFTACKVNDGACTQHVDSDGNGYCDVCGEELESTKPDDSSDSSAAKVEFDINGGKFTVPTETVIQVEKGMRLQLPAAEREGYVFCGWYDGDSKWNIYDSVSENLVLRARWLEEDQNEGKVTVRFALNDGTDTILKEVTVDIDGYVASADAPSNPVREGYRFAGWHTRNTISENDLVGGVSKYMYYLGQSKSSAGFWSPLESTFDPVCGIENITDEGTATLYARWVKVKEISTEEELNEVRNDLYGAYKLVKDITLTQPWQPIGSYYSNYELFETEWWIHAFRGSFDGNGYTINGLHFSGVKSNNEDGIHLVTNEGEYGVGVIGLFGGLVAPAEIHDLTIQNCIVEESFNGGCYAGILAGFMMGATVDNIQALDSNINITTVDGGYISVTGLVGGFWTGTVKNSKTTGVIDFVANRKASDIGEIFVGGISGECYSFVENCETEFEIEVEVNDESIATENGHLQVSVGGINGANCYLTDSKTQTDITVVVNGGTGKTTLRMGLAVGIERYGYIRGCTVEGNITVNQPENKNAVAYKGSILGGFDNSTYALVGAMFDPALKVRYVENNTVRDDILDFVGEPFENNENFTHEVRNNSRTES